jgi:hypothetical protein
MVRYVISTARRRGTPCGVAVVTVLDEARAARQDSMQFPFDESDKRDKQDYEPESRK